MTRAGRAALAMVAAVGLLAVATAGPVGAGTPPPSTTPANGQSSTSLPPVVTSPPATGSTKLSLVSQPAWVTVETSLPLGLHIEGPVDDGMTIDVVAHQAVDSRIVYDRALRGQQLGPVAGQVIRVPLPFVPPGPGDVRNLSIPLQSATDRDPNKLALRPTDAGVFPVEVSLADADGNQLSTFVTPVVVTPQTNGAPAISEPLNVAWVWPLATRPALLPDGTPDPEVVADLRPTGRIGAEAELLDQHDVPVTLAPGPETLEAWRVLANPSADNQDIAGTLTALTNTAADAQVLNSPYVPIDVPSLVAGGFQAEVGPEYDRGFDTLLNGLAQPIDESTAILDPADDRALAQLREEGVARVVIRDTALEPANDDLTPTQAFQLGSDQRTYTAVASDSSLARLLDGPDPPALRAQRFLAALSLVALELPNAERGVVILNDPSAPPDRTVLDLALDGLAAANPLVAAVRLRSVFDIDQARDDAGAPVVRELAPITPVDPPVTRAQFDATAVALAGYRDLVPTPTPGSLAAGLLAKGDRALLTTLSSAWNNPAGRARAQAELAAVTSGIDSFVGQIHVPVNPTITVTARTAEIPITFLNDTDQTVQVRVHLSSADLTFPDGRVRDIELPPRNTTIRFAVEARGSGTFPLELRVTSPDGTLQLSQTEVQVRSTFVSNVGVFLTVGAVLFLALWWGNDFRRRRRRAAEAAPDPGAAATPPPAVAPGTPR